MKACLSCFRGTSTYSKRIFMHMHIFSITFDVKRFPFAIWHVTCDVAFYMTWHSQMILMFIVHSHWMMDSVVIFAIWVWLVSQSVGRDMDLRDARGESKNWQSNGALSCPQYLSHLNTKIVHFSEICENFKNFNTKIVYFSEISENFKNFCTKIV